MTRPSPIPAADSRSRLLLQRWQDAQPRAVVRLPPSERVRLAAADLTLRVVAHRPCWGQGCSDCEFFGTVVVVAEPN